MQELIDSRNKDLWDKLSEKYNVSFEQSENEEYGVFSENDHVTFKIDYNNLCKDSFTHEMLHVYLRLMDCYIGAGLKNTIKMSKILSNIMTYELLEHIGNCLDHIKILPQYLDMGFDREKFLLDYHASKCTEEELLFIKRNYKSGKFINPEVADSFMGVHIAILADPNESHDYTYQLNQLKKIDPLLFNINEKLIDFWKEIKIENREPFDDNYNTVLFNYYENLKKWISKSKILK